MSLLTDQLRLDCTVAPKLTDRLLLSAEVFDDQLSDAVTLGVSISPKLTDSVALLATVKNQTLQTAGEANVLAPAAEITFE